MCYVRQENSKHFKSAGDIIPSLLNTPKMEMVTRRIMCKGVVDQRADADIFNETMIESFSVNYSSSPLDHISLYSQEDPSESHRTLSYLLQKPSEKGNSLIICSQYP